MSIDSRSASVIGHRASVDAWQSVSGEVVVGKDILELLSSSMYVDPMAIYREYIQNAADAIDEARESGVLGKHTPGRVDITIDPESRTVRIRDNGIGLHSSEFSSRLTSFGASVKRDRAFRGFRGVGRLAGIGYAQELVFRSRSKGERTASELKWDCRQLKSLLRSGDREKHLKHVVEEAVRLREVDGREWPEHFFEVELGGIVRHKNDRLIDPSAIEAHLAQVAPIPFAPDFGFATAINEFLRPSVKLGELEVYLPGATQPIYRAHRQNISLGSGRHDTAKDIDLFSLPSVDGGVAALGWILHHGYTGALPAHTLVKGLRVRVGNLQVGDERLLEDLFQEPRFNSWSIGEIHVIDPRVVPNGRRDHFEQTVHYLNVLNHLTPVARDITRRCRTISVQRNRAKECARQIEVAAEKLSIIQQGTLSKLDQRRLVREIKAALATVEKEIGNRLLDGEREASLIKDMRRVRRQMKRIKVGQPLASPLGRLSEPQRKTYQQVFALVYECAPSRPVAKAIIDRVLARL